MIPDFSQKTKDTLAKRAAYKCSSPECGKLTVGPNSTPEKATLIGEVAHIYGARKNAKRFNPDMSDIRRAQITNGIWLCSNCHTLIDSDQLNYPSELLFRWRENHEKSIIKEIGTASDQIRFDIKQKEVEKYADYPSHIKRIIFDKPEAWEYQLTTEMMRYLCFPLFEKIESLRHGIYSRPLVEILDREILDFVSLAYSDMFQLFSVTPKIFSCFESAWGNIGEQGKVEEIQRACILLNDHLEQVIAFEERVRFVKTEDEFKPIIKLLVDKIALQSIKLKQVTEHTEEIVSILNADHKWTKENPLIIQKSIEIDLPETWVEEVMIEYRNIKSILESRSTI